MFANCFPSVKGLAMLALAAVVIVLCLSTGAFAIPYPFCDNMEDTTTGNWVFDSPWGYDTQYAHSGIRSISDSPGGSSYQNNVNISAKLSPISLATAQMPVLSFWHRYSLELNADYGYIDISVNAGATWTTIYFVTGNHPQWKEEKIDLSQWIPEPDVRIRFRLKTNSSVTYDGWYIDDVCIKETTNPTIAYPFFDDMEDTAVTNANWLSSSWELVSPGHSGSYCWTESPVGNYPRDIYTFLSLAGTIDLTGAQAPQLVFWHKGDLYSYYYDSVWVQIGRFQGGQWNWTTVTSYKYYNIPSEWTRVQIDLTSFVGTQIKVRFLLRDDNIGNQGDGWYIDDVLIQNSPSYGPSIYVSPGEFYVPLNVNDTTSQTLTIENRGDGALTFQILEAVGGGPLTKGNPTINTTTDENPLKILSIQRGPLFKDAQTSVAIAKTSDSNPFSQFTMVNVPWVSENPTSGTVLPGDSAKVTVTFDARGLERGGYHAYLVIMNNDPDSDLVVVELHLSVNAPGPFSLIQPLNGDSIDLPKTFHWGNAIDPDSGDIVRYDVWLTPGIDFSDSIVKIEDLQDTSTSIAGLMADTTWYWKVRAYDQRGADRWSNETWSFYTGKGFLRGDANGDGVINIADVVYLINYLFIGGPAPVPLAAGDANCDGVVSSADVVYLINYLFIGGPAPGC